MHIERDSLYLLGIILGNLFSAALGDKFRSQKAQEKSHAFQKELYVSVWEQDLAHCTFSPRNVDAI